MTLVNCQIKLSVKDQKGLQNQLHPPIYFSASILLPLLSSLLSTEAVHNISRGYGPISIKV